MWLTAHCAKTFQLQSKHRRTKNIAGSNISRRRCSCSAGHGCLTGFQCFKGTKNEGYVWSSILKSSVRFCAYDPRLSGFVRLKFGLIKNWIFEDCVSVRLSKDLVFVSSSMRHWKLGKRRLRWRKISLTECAGSCFNRGLTEDAHRAFCQKLRFLLTVGKLSNVSSWSNGLPRSTVPDAAHQISQQFGNAYLASDCSYSNCKCWLVR